MPKENKIINVTCLLVISSLIAVLVYLAIKYLAPALLPFIFAWGLALSLKKPIAFIEKKAKITHKSAAVITVIAVSFVAVYLIFLLFSALFGEIREIYLQLANSSTTANIEQSFENLFESVGMAVRRIPYIGQSSMFEGFSKNIKTRFPQMFSELLPKAVSFVGGVIGKLAGAVPYFALLVLVCIIAAFYFCTDLERINRSVAGVFPKKAREVLFVVKQELFSVFFGYIRAYSIIITMTFIQLFIGLSIIGIKYNLLLSVLISLVDILPVLGAGTVLVPWGATLVFFGNSAKGISILVLYLIITVIRQFAEPRIVGNMLGLHPLCTLLAIYVGARLFGIWGIFLLPITLIVAKNVSERISPKTENRKTERAV